MFSLVVLLLQGMAVLLWTCPRLCEDHRALSRSNWTAFRNPSSGTPLLIVWLERQRTDDYCLRYASCHLFGSDFESVSRFWGKLTWKLKLIETLGGWGRKKSLWRLFFRLLCRYCSVLWKLEYWSLSGFGVIIGEFYRCQKRALLPDHLYSSQTFKLYLGTDVHYHSCASSLLSCTNSSDWLKNARR